MNNLRTDPACLARSASSPIERSLAGGFGAHSNGRNKAARLRVSVPMKPLEHAHQASARGRLEGAGAARSESLLKPGLCGGGLCTLEAPPYARFTERWPQPRGQRLSSGRQSEQNIPAAPRLEGGRVRGASSRRGFQAPCRLRQCRSVHKASMRGAHTA